MIEIFKPIPGYPGYGASQLGKIKGPGRKILKPSMWRGYLRVGVGYETIKVHRLVLLAWVGPPLPGQECCHGPRGKQCNEISNLRWDTRQENIKDIARWGSRRYNHLLRDLAIRRALRQTPRHGVCHGMSRRVHRRIIFRICRRIHSRILRSDGRSWKNANVAAIELGLNTSSILAACRRPKSSLWKNFYAGFYWQFESDVKSE